MRIELAAPMTLAEIQAAIGGSGSVCGDATVRAISTDTRTLRPGDLFIALHGEKADGHAFLDAATAAGASASVCEAERDCAITVKNTHTALLSLAAHSLETHRIPVVAITGSVGKTGTKEAIAAALSSVLRVHKTEENENNELGVAKTVLSRPASARVLVLEFGSNHPGEIAPLSLATRPDVSVLTAIGSAHIGAFGSQEAILAEKASIVAGMKEGHIIFSKDDPLLFRFAFPFPTTGVSVGGTGDLVADGIYFSRFGTSYTARWNSGERRIFLRGVGRPRVYASLFALATAMRLGVPVPQAADALFRMPQTAGRGSIHEADGVLLIDDAYNASPEAVEEGLSLLTAIAAPRHRVAVLGDMLELGERSDELHRGIGRCAARHAHSLYTFGSLAAEIAKGAHEVGMPHEEIHIASTAEDCAKALLRTLSDGDAVLVKASHALGGDRIVTAIRDRARYPH